MAAVPQVCRVAGTAYGLTSLVAVTTLDNLASRAVLERSAFTAVEDITLGGRPGVRYRRSHLAH
jgi:ribosomal-protein-alanine N-acetyltransferase